MIDKQQILKLTYEEFIAYLKQLSRNKQLELLNDNKILRKVFLLDSQEKNGWKFEQMLDIYSFNDLYPYINKELIQDIKNKYKNSKDAFLIFFLRKYKDELILNIFNNQEFLKFFIEQSEWFYFDLEFDYEFVKKIIKYLEENSFDYSRMFTKYIINFQNNFLDKNLKTNFKREMILITSNIVKVIINYKTTFDDIPDIKTFVINLCNTTLESLLKENKISKSILENQDFLDNLNLFNNSLVNFLTIIDKKLLARQASSLEYDENFVFNLARISIENKEEQEKMLNEDMTNRTKRMLMKAFDKKIVLDYLRNNIVTLTNDIIASFLYSYGLKLPTNLYEKKDFFSEYVLSTNLTEMRDNIQSIERSNNASYFYKLKDEMYDKIINLYDQNSKVLTYYNQENNATKKEPYEIFLDKYKLKNPDKSLQDLTKKILVNIVIDKLFADNIRNVCMNISELLHYNLTLKKSLLTTEKIIFYQSIEKLFNATSDEVLQFYYKYKDTNVISEFYDDIRTLKNLSYQEIKDSCIKISKIEKLKNDELSSSVGVDVYEYNGQEFTALVSCLASVQVDLNTFERNCYSLISNNNMKVFLEHEIIFGYVDFDINNILHVYESDSKSNDTVSGKNTKYINRIRKPSEILSSNMMNEIQLANQLKEINGENGIYQRISPSYVICFDSINEESLNAAKTLNIPIIKINRKMYTKNECIISSQEDEKLVTYYETNNLKDSEDSYKKYSL